MLDVDSWTSAVSERRAQSSSASHRSSNGQRFHRPHRGHTAHIRPRARSKAIRRPTGKCSSARFLPSDEGQKRQFVYMEVRLRSNAKGQVASESNNGERSEQSENRLTTSAIVRWPVHGRGIGMRDRETVHLDTQPEIRYRRRFSIVVTRESIPGIEIKLAHDAPGIQEVALDASEQAIDGGLVDGPADSPPARVPDNCAPSNDH